MEINKKSRTELKMYFVRNAIPTEGNFRDLIEGMLNHKDDGLTKSADSPLSIEAASTGERPAIHLYDSFVTAQTPSWVVSLLPGVTSAGKTIGKGLGIGDGAGAAKARLFVEAATGNLGIGIVDPAGYKLNVAGSLNASGAISASGGLSVPVGQSLTANGPLYATAGAVVSGGVLNANGAINANAGLTVGTVASNQNATVNGALTVTGLSTTGVLNASGAVNANAGLMVGTVASNQNATVNGALTVTGLSTTGVLNASGAVNANAGLTVGTVASNQNATVNGALTITGLSTTGVLNASGAVNANAGLTVGTVASNQNATVNGALTVTGLCTTGDLTVGSPSTNKTLTVNGALGVNQLSIGNSGATINGELTLYGVAALFDNTIFLRSKADRNHGVGYYGANKLFQGRDVNGPVLFGYAGGALGTVTAPAWSVDGAVVLDGTNSCVQLPALNFDFSKGLTIEAWVYYNSFNNWSRIIDFGNGQALDNVVLANSGTTADLAFSSIVGGGDRQVVAKGALKTGVWMHVAATVDLSGMGVLYVNGVSLQTGQSQLPINLVRSSNFIGKSNWPNDGWMNGKIANLRVWQRPLSASEINDSIMVNRSVVSAQAPAPWVTGLAAFWPLSDATGLTARDLSGKGLTGTLQGKAAFESYQRLALTWDNQSNVTVPGNGTLTARMHPTVQSFQVGGAWEKFYPILFSDDGWNDGALELHITRADTHQDSGWRGTTICIIRCHSTNYGHGSGFCKIVEHYYRTNQFVGGIANSWHTRQLVVWLRGGGTTYQWRTNHPARLVDATALDTRSIVFTANVADNELYPAKTTPDTNLSAVDAG